MSDDPSSPYGSERSDRPTVTGIISEAIARIRGEPRLVVPFALASVVLAGVNMLRLHDPIPTQVVEGLSSGTISIVYHVYPTAAQRTVLPLGALVNLKLPYLAWAIGLELLALLAIGTAGWYTLARGANVEMSVRSFGSYLVLVAAIQSAFRLFGLFGDFGPVVGIVLIVLVLWVMVRLFVTPLFVAAGDDPITAGRRSASVTTGRGVLVGLLVVSVGLATWLLGSVPLVGTLLSGTLVAPVHAVAIVVLSEFEGIGAESTREFSSS